MSEEEEIQVIPIRSAYRGLEVTQADVRVLEATGLFDKMDLGVPYKELAFDLGMLDNPVVKHLVLKIINADWNDYTPEEKLQQIKARIKMCLSDYGVRGKAYQSSDDGRTFETIYDETQ